MQLNYEQDLSQVVGRRQHPPSGALRLSGKLFNFLPELKKKGKKSIE